MSRIVYFSGVLVTISAVDDPIPVRVLSPVVSHEDWYSVCIKMHFFVVSQDTVFPASPPSTGHCVFLHLAMLQTSRWLYRTHCRDTLRALAFISKSGSLMTCVRQRMTDSISQTLPSLLGKECEFPFKQNVSCFMINCHVCCSRSSMHTTDCSRNKEVKQQKQEGGWCLERGNILCQARKAGLW